MLNMCVFISEMRNVCKVESYALNYN